MHKFHWISLYRLSIVNFAAMIKVGDSFWYGKKVSHNLKSAARMYAEAASKNDHPHVSNVSAWMFSQHFYLVAICTYVYCLEFTHF